MKSFNEWKLLNSITEETSLAEWIPLLEATTNSRYSIEVNFRSKLDEILSGYAKIVLAYVSAAMKQSGYHTKHVYDQEPLRIIVSSRNWDSGENVGIVYFHPDHEGGSFIMSKGFYNRDVKTISMQSRTKCKDSAAEITTDLRNLMHQLKNMPDKNIPAMKKVPLKRGPRS